MRPQRKFRVARALFISLFLALALRVVVNRWGPQVAQSTASAIVVVRSGETLMAIAARFDHGGNPYPLVYAISRETGSTTIYPGERIRIPSPWG